MSSDVLVLNRNFYAIQIADWRRALTLLYCDHARVVDDEYRTYNFEDWRELSQMMSKSPSGFVTTPTFRIAIPEVIALRRYDRLPVGEVKFTRRNIYGHYSYRCCYCGSKFATQELNLEHVLPRSRGGKTDWSNIVTSCMPCNLRKADRLPAEAGNEASDPADQAEMAGQCVARLPRPGEDQSLLAALHRQRVLEHRA